jgi:hypothetical protein
MMTVWVDALLGQDDTSSLPGTGMVKDTDQRPKRSR